MKKFILPFVILLFSSNIIAQNLPKFGELVRSYEGLTGYCKFAKYTMDSFIPTGEQSYFCRENINRILQKNTTKASYLPPAKKTALMQYYNNIKSIDDVYLSKLSFDVSFAKDSNDKICIYAGSFFYYARYNTERTTEIERAKDAINSALIPILQQSGKYLIEIQYDYVLIGMGYLTKQPQESSSEGAAIYCIIPTKDIDNFLSLEISSDELIKNSKIYIKDIGGLKLTNL